MENHWLIFPVDFHNQSYSFTYFLKTVRNHHQSYSPTAEFEWLVLGIQQLSPGVFCGLDIRKCDGCADPYEILVTLR